jgi:thiamine-phosphate pyrophosphorylase
MQNRLHSMQLYAITGRGLSSAGSQSEAVFRRQLLRLVESWTAGGVHFIQLREKDLSAADLQSLAREMAETIDRRRSRLLVNVSGAESAALAAAAGADGVHLAGKPTPGAALRARQLFRAAARTAGRTADLDALISVPCHTLGDIHVARKEQVDLMLFSPVFEKLAGEKLAAPKAEPQGLEALRQACAAAEGIPVLALGGVTSINAQDCRTAGAAGVAGIRLFATDDWRLLPPN